ncbi:type II toxin-antitoxin system VapC family toxin [Candidatus Poribacteria bacterium]|nr:type II toxin-antitoxin system VapC family toxin [Candidatus Poribacteria bacterium]
MGKTDITIDTHTMLWYLDSDYNFKLSKMAFDVIAKAEMSGTIYVPMITLAEALHQIDRGKFNITFEKLMSCILDNEAYEIVPFDERILENAVPLKSLEIHDRLIIATALANNTSLLSKDRELIASGLNVIWSKRDDIP